MKAILFLGQAPYQDHLLDLAATKMQVVGVVRHQEANPKSPLFHRLVSYALNPADAIRHIKARLTLPKYKRHSSEVIEKLFGEKFSSGSLPACDTVISVYDINDSRAVQFVRDLSPDIVLVHGTNLLRKPMLDLANILRLGFINLHTGLSPYSRGGNSNLFMLLEGHPELVGVTVHVIDPGIDSGDILVTNRPILIDREPYEVIEAKCFHLGFDLLVQTALELDSGRLKPVPQWTSGKLFLKRTGYVYRPWYRLKVNQMIDKGLIRDYLVNKTERDSGVRLVGAEE